MKGLLGKFYVSKIYRRTGFEERCVLEVMKFAFDIMKLEKLIIFVNEPNQYFFKLLLYVHFRLIKMKPKNNGAYNRLMLSMNREDYDELMQKHYKKLIKNKFYNHYIMEHYRDNLQSSLSSNTGMYMKGGALGRGGNNQRNHMSS